MTESPLEDAGNETPEEVAASAATSAEDTASSEEPTAEGNAAEGGAEDAVPLTREEELEAKVTELTSDLQRKQAEFINYKRRVEDDRVKAIETGKQTVISALLTVLDDIGRADEHGELVGGFKAVADALIAELDKFGLEKYAEAGEEFDPQIHDAVFHTGTSSEVATTSIAQVMKVGYRLKDKVIRAAVVSVVDPEN